MHSLDTLLQRRLLVIDGAMGTMIQRARLSEEDFRGERFAGHPTPLKGCNDLLCLTRPDVIGDIHRAYLEAGADIIETNTFNAQAVSLLDYGLQDQVFAINEAGARLARFVADEFTRRRPDKPRFVAGSIGPTNRTASLSPDVNDPGVRAISFAQLHDAYAEQVRGLLKGGVDLLLPETTFDTLNLKAALAAIETVFAEFDARSSGRTPARVPVIASVTITDASGRTLSGQTLEACWISIAHAPLLAVGLNCALGAEQLAPYVEELSALAPIPTACVPNAGLPNEFGGYDQTPDRMAALVAPFLRRGWVNLIGGCCGTTPDHIRALVELAARHQPRRVPEIASAARYSGLEALVLRPDTNFLMIGERTNVTGSRKFAKLIEQDDYEGALSVARQQVENGANILDVCMDAGLLDVPRAMTRFLHLCMAEPDIARVPIMVDSSRFEVLAAGLACVQGKALVNSLSLKEGEAVFLDQARTVRRFGAAVVVMAFDEEGQAADAARKVAILDRAYRLLTEQAGFAGDDIIFDPCILTVGTGMEEHADYALTFLEATRELKRRFPRAKVSGGVSNLSFAFRGNDLVREAMHAAFLYHAIDAGMDMGIVNAGQLAVYEDIPKDLLDRVEDVILNRRGDATERLIAFAATMGAREKVELRRDAWREEGVEQRLAYALRHGLTDFLDGDLQELLDRGLSALSIVEGPLMDGMSQVGELFGAGKMFLPQVVKSARVMKKAVAFLEPHFASEGEGVRAQGKVLLATVKGDVHDIGKNIVGVVLGCNHFEVIDLGVMVPGETILNAARQHGVDMVGLSGLITPSLDEMAHVAELFERSGMEIPLLIGGATTSRRHTAVKIAPRYSQPVLHGADASRAASLAQRLQSRDLRAALLEENRVEQARLRREFEARAAPVIALAKARDNRARLDFDAATCPPPPFLGIRPVEASLFELSGFIDWSPFFHAWEFRGKYPRLLDDPRQGEAARELDGHAREVLAALLEGGELRAQGLYGFLPTASDGDDLVLFADETRREERLRLPMLRQQMARDSDKPHWCLADLLPPLGHEAPGALGLFAVTTGLGLDAVVARYKRDDDDYRALIAQALADRFAEAFAEWLHLKARRQWYAADENLDSKALAAERYRGIRPAPGYPACPDHETKRRMFALFEDEARVQGFPMSMTLTESAMIAPAASVSGLYFAHPQSHYFSVGRLARDQIEDYAARCGEPAAAIERRLSTVLSDPSST